MTVEYTHDEPHSRNALALGSDETVAWAAKRQRLGSRRPVPGSCLILSPQFNPHACSSGGSNNPRPIPLVACQRCNCMHVPLMQGSWAGIDLLNANYMRTPWYLHLMSIEPLDPYYRLPPLVCTLFRLRGLLLSLSARERRPRPQVGGLSRPICELASQMDSISSLTRCAVSVFAHERNGLKSPAVRGFMLFVKGWE